MLKIKNKNSVQSLPRSKPAPPKLHHQHLLTKGLQLLASHCNINTLFIYADEWYHRSFPMGHAHDLGALTETAGCNIRAASPIHFSDADEANLESSESSEAEDHKMSEAEDHERSEAEDYEMSDAEAEDHELSEAEDYETSETEELATTVRACAERARRAIKAQRKQTTLADLVAQADTDALLIAQFKAVRIAKVRAAGGTIVTLLRCLRLISTNNSKLKQRRRLLLMLLGQRNPTLLLRNYLPKVKQAELHMLVAKLGS